MTDKKPTPPPATKRLRHRPLVGWYDHHCVSLLSSLSDLFRTPFASIMTFLVIGIAMALPSAFYILLTDLQDMGQHWNHKPSISLYLKKETSDAQITATLTDLKKNPDIDTVQYISPEEGLKAFKEAGDFGDTLSSLDQNPLPGVIVITPSSHEATPSNLQNLVAKLQTLPGVDTSQLDLNWVKRLYSIVAIAKRITYSLALLFGLGVLLIIGNTIRLTTQRYHEEMRVLSLIGATNAFIRRPLLYRGLLYGFFGGTIACLLVAIMLWWLQKPVQSLIQTYNHTLFFQGLPLLMALYILGTTALLGLLGALLATHHQIRTLEA